MGICDTAGFVRHRANTGTVCTHTHYGYGVCGYGCGVENPDPRYTRAEPYRPGYDPGYFFLYELSVYIQVEYSLAIFFSGLLYHCGTPSCTIDGSEPENDAVRLTIILYPTLEGGQLLDFAAIPGSKMQTFHVPPEMSEAV